MKHLALIALTVLFLIPANVRADDGEDRAEQEKDYISLGVGLYDSFRVMGIHDDEDYAAADFRLEYRAGSMDLFWNIHPWVGLELTSDASLWAGAGLYRDFRVGERIVITPNFGVGAYAQGDSDLDLGGTLEFRSQIEAAYEFDDKSRLGVALGHISNASTGDSNPGTEIINMYYHIPVGGLSMNNWELY